MSAPRSPGRASSSTRTASGINHSSAVSLSPLLQACMRSAVLHPAPAIPPARIPELSTSSRPMTCHVPAALPSSPMRGLQRRCEILRACAAAGRRLVRSATPRRGTTVRALVRGASTWSRGSLRRPHAWYAIFPAGNNAHFVVSGAPATRIYGRAAASCGHGSCYSEPGWRTGCSPSCPCSARRSWYANIWIP
jgi:hypothetical protein